MHKFPSHQYKKFHDLPFDEFNKLKFSIYILDFKWNYIFINDFVKNNLGERGQNLLGKNMWDQFPELAVDPSFKELKKNLENHIVTNLTTTSPINSKRLNISGVRLEDCFYCTSSILPNKEDLIDEIRRKVLKRTN